MNKSLTAVLVSLLCLSAPAHAQQAAPALDKVIMEFVNAFNARDLAKVSSLYADDAVWMRADSPMIKGRAAIAAELTRRYQGPGVLTLTGTMSGTSGSLAFVAATYTVTVPLEDGGQVSVPAKSLTVFKRVGNAWKICVRHARRAASFLRGVAARPPVSRAARFRRRALDIKRANCHIGRRCSPSLGY